MHSDISYDIVQCVGNVLYLIMITHGSHRSIMCMLIYTCLKATRFPSLQALERSDLFSGRVEFQYGWIMQLQGGKITRAISSQHVSVSVCGVEGCVCGVEGDAWKVACMCYQ